MDVGVNDDGDGSGIRNSHIYNFLERIISAEMIKHALKKKTKKLI